MSGKREITWVHFALDRHEVVYANGCATESLLLGPQVINSLKVGEYRDLLKVYPKAPKGQALNGPAARTCLKVGQVKRILQRSSTVEMASVSQVKTMQKHL